MRSYATPRSFSRAYVLCFLLALIVASPVDAQERSPDARLLQAVYEVDAPAFRVIMRGADWSAYPVFAAAPVGMWTGAMAMGAEHDAAYRLTLAETLAFGSAFILKRLYQRKRPYRVMPRVKARMNVLDRHFVGGRRSFPSGHAALSFALATSWSLSYPRWTVVVPSLAWATTVTISRLWTGVHYPSDVLAGALLGTGVGIGVHVLRAMTTPEVLQDEKGAAPATVTVRLRF